MVRGADFGMGFVGVRAWASELARMFLARWLTGHALRQASAQARTPPKPPYRFRPPGQGRLFAGGRERRGSAAEGEDCADDEDDALGGKRVGTLTAGAKTAGSMRPPGKGRWDLHGFGTTEFKTTEFKTTGFGTNGFVAAGVFLLVMALVSGGRAEEGNFSATETEAGGYGHQYEAPPKKASKDSTAKAGKKVRAKRGALKPVLPAADSGSAGDGPKPAAGDTSAADSTFGGLGADSGNGSVDSAAAETVRKDSGSAEAREEAAEAPALILLPMVVAREAAGARGDFEKTETALRLGLTQSGRFKVWTVEEAGRTSGGGDSLPRDCFSERCLVSEAAKAGSAFIVASQYSSRDSVKVLKLVLAEVPGGRLVRAVQVWGRPGREGIIPFAREAAMRLALPEEDRDRERKAAGMDGSFTASRPWRQVPWLNPRDTLDNRRHWGWAGSGILLAGAGLAYAQGQLLQEDGNRSHPAKDVLSGAGAQSFLRGFFAAPTLGARYAAMGGAGIAHVGNGLALLMNPAGVAEADRENVVAAKRSLPDGTPSFFLAYAGPLYRQWTQGVGVQFEGDKLANETTLHGALGYDLGTLAKELAGVKVGAQAKAYLAQVGESGVGQDRSTGRSFGMGLDLGLQARLSDKITAALAVRDAAGFLRHTNTFTDESYAELLPVEYRLGAAYRASRSLLLLLDGQKAVWADQVDHLRLGAEQVLLDFLALRCGLHEIFGREAVRKMSLGFGVDTDGLGDKSLKMKITLNYAYEFGLGDDEPLGAGQQFSLEAGF